MNWANRPRRLLLKGVALSLAMAAAWTLWAELHPTEERALRMLVHDQLDNWFPELMSAPGDGFGVALRQAAEQGAMQPPVLLIHGLDEPGIIWDDLVVALADAGFDVWELRYPNDQGIDRSADFLARHWAALPAEQPVILIGHSMGGLVAREFVTRLRYPPGPAPQLEGAPVGGLVMIGTPNHGSPWARLRIWLELREHFEDARQRRFTLFAGLRDGVGEAKVDLRPGSNFLKALNARPWPDAVPRFLIGAQLLSTPSSLTEGLDAAAAEVGSEALREHLHAWWQTLTNGLGDGAVSVASLRLEDAPPPVIVNATHRTMLRRLGPDDPEPPAIRPIIAQLQRWSQSP
ncbi:alpha/beta fold hydrolase [Thiohalocapsa marina]|uniref:Alpha/beta fold hydrolase n=1 Tax=Thiohalocapsa marina TaxID=424902 RepID=A0A5M8FQ04_9GAMM|nr:alpha/beta fold hydrolase [Thiohalocapsa marina]KAA6186584.1 alpha/beta fold hydrolase [Thiohalocapsa marina]